MSLCLTIFDPMDCSPPGPIPFSRGSSQSRDHTWNSCIAGRFFTIWATAKSPKFLFNSVPSSPRREHSPWLKARTFLSSSFYLFQLFFFFLLSAIFERRIEVQSRGHLPPTPSILLYCFFPHGCFRVLTEGSYLEVSFCAVSLMTDPVWWGLKNVRTALLKSPQGLPGSHS